MATRPRATIRLSAIVDNWRALSAAASGAEAGAVVKANAYGHGLAETGRALAAAGCRTFFTAYVFEAVALREAIGPGPAIMVFHGFCERSAQDVRDAQITPILNTLEQVRCWRAESMREVGGAVLHFDTGMNRLGLRPGDLGAVKNMLDGRPVGYVMSHLACADEPKFELNARQRALFLELAMEWPEAKRSLGNTAAIALGSDYAFDLVRPGIGLFGGGHGLRNLAPALTLEAPILTVFEAAAGSTTGYGATRRFGRPRRLATVALGYADGFPRHASNRGFAYVDGVRCPVVGRVSMDLCTLDVSSVDGMIAEGKMVEFIGASADLELQAEAVGTLGYELLTGLSDRIERVWAA